MARVMMLVDAQGKTLAEVSLAPGSMRAAHDWERILRDQARSSGFSEDEIAAANIAIGGDHEG